MARLTDDHCNQCGFLIRGDDHFDEPGWYSCPACQVGSVTIKAAPQPPKAETLEEEMGRRQVRCIRRGDCTGLAKEADEKIQVLETMVMLFALELEDQSKEGHSAGMWTRIIRERAEEAVKNVRDQSS